MTDRFIRDPNRKWRTLGSKLTDKKFNSGAVVWHTSAKGNKWFNFREWHVVVFPVVQERPYGKLLWFVRISENGVTVSQKNFESEEAVMAYALMTVGLKKAPDSDELVEMKFEPQEIPPAGVLRRIKA